MPQKSPSRRPARNIFEDVCLGKAAAEKLRIQAKLADQIWHYIETHQLTQAQAAERFDVTQPRISDLLRGKYHLFSIDSLVEMLIRAGIPATIKVRKVTG